MTAHYQKSARVGWWLGAIALVLPLLAASLSLRKSPQTNREVALRCTTDMATQFHIHPQLKIMINGAPQEVPANIGIGARCMNALHTHDASGTIHVESPEKRDFTLADFFAVWGKPFSQDQIIRETVNGIEVKDYENTVFRDKDQIVIYYELR